MSSEDTNDAADFATGTFKLSDDIILSRKMRVAGMLYLEQKYGVGIDQIDFKNDHSMSKVVDLMVAMMLSYDVTLDPDDCLNRIRRFDQDDLDRATAILNEATEVRAKNAEPPAAGKPGTKNPANL